LDTNPVIVNSKVLGRDKKAMKALKPAKVTHDPKKPAETKQHLGRYVKEKLTTTQHVEVGTQTVPIDDRYLDFDQEQ
jgi:hypothetical protein